MPVGQKELGQRVQDAREVCRLTQEEMAPHLRVSCSTVTQMELGNRAITSLEFERIAYLFGRDMWEFFSLRSSMRRIPWLPYSELTPMWPDKRTWSTRYGGASRSAVR